VLAVLVLIVALIIIVLLPGQSQCVRASGELDCGPGTPGVFTTARIATGALGVVVSIALWFAASVIDTR
jgi:hypothetical protein